MKRLLILVVILLSTICITGCKEKVTIEFIIQDTSKIVKVDKGMIISRDIVPVDKNAKDFELYYGPTKGKKYYDEPINEDTSIYVKVLEEGEELSLEELEYRAKKLYLETVIKRPNATVKDAKLHKFYGVYHGNYVCCLVNGRIYWHSDLQVEYIIEDLIFKHGEDYWIYVYKDGRLLTLSEAYENGNLTYDDIYAIYRIRYRLDE